MDRIHTDRFIRDALLEDMPFGDITTDNIFDDDHVSEAYMVARNDGILCGIDIAIRVFCILDDRMIIDSSLEDGDIVKSGDILLELKGRTKALLKGERTALNILQRLSGIATSTGEYVKEVEGYDVRIADTRKTTPLLRMFEKYAVSVGGGTNHRYSLSDAVMMKDNHIDALGGIIKGVAALRERVGHTVKIEVEADTIDKVRQAVEAKADIIMLDNMTIEEMEISVAYVNKRAIVEASGNITKELLKDVAKTGVDVISIGRLTHTVKNFDISMKIKKSC
jgi:nicotinate-nucleotide pyrophosphorylase (carboxylating)